MSAAPFSSLRVRLVLLVLIAVVPALVLIFYSGWEERRAVREQGQNNALQLAKLASQERDDLIEGARQLLIALSQIPAVKERDGARCNAFMAELREQYRRYTNFGAVDAKGDLYCSAVPPGRSVNLADRPFFMRAVDSRGFVAGDYVTDRITGQPLITFAYPVLSRESRVSGVVFAGLDLAWLNELVARTSMPQGTTLTLADRNGTILAQYPDPLKWVGKTIPEAPLLRMIQTTADGVTEGTGPDGQDYLFGFAHLRDAPEAHIFVAVSVPKKAAFARVDHVLRRNLLALGLVTVVALFGAWIGGNLLILRRVRKLVGATKRLGTADLSARSGLDHDTDELGQLATSFDEMAESLEHHHKQLEALRDIERAIGSTLEHREVLNILLRKIGEWLPYSVAVVRLRNRETGDLEPVAYLNVDREDWKPELAPPGKGFSEVVAKQRSPLTITNALEDPRLGRPDFVRSEKLVSYLGVPLIAKDELLGVMGFLTKHEHRFDDDEVEFMSTLAGQVAVAIQNSRLYEQTRNQAAELDKANKERADFMAMIVHDLRSPLTAIMSGAGMLEEGLSGPVSEDQKKWLRKIQANSRIIVDLINDILDLSKLEAGRIDLLKSEVDLSVVVRNCIDNYLVLAREREVSLKNSLPPALPRFAADPRRLEQVFNNLISNAVKFTPGGGQIDVGAALENSSRMKIWVRDSGVGIPAGELGQIFQKYRQTMSGKTSQDKGTGLGLVICKMIVESHGGKIWAESQEGKGTTFFFTLPLGNNGATGPAGGPS
jgi:signal transduction histidine kinase/HAMP domain-containing protein